MNLGILSNNGTKDYWYNGLRVEVFLDGKADDAFKVSFTKMIREQDKGNINQDLANELIKFVRPLAAIAKSRQQAQSPKLETPKEIEDNMKKLTEFLNKNTSIAEGVNTRGKNEKRGSHIDTKKDHKKQENPNKEKKRKEIWFEGFDFVNDGETGPKYRADVREGKNWILINQDHIYYKKIFSQLNVDLQWDIATDLAGDIVAKSRCGYWYNEEKQKAIDEYNLIRADYLRDALKS